MSLTSFEFWYAVALPVETTGCTSSYLVRGAGNLQLRDEDSLWPTDEWQRCFWLAAAAAANRVHVLRVTGGVMRVTSCSNYRSLPVVTSVRAYAQYVPCMQRTRYSGPVAAAADTATCPGVTTVGAYALLPCLSMIARSSCGMSLQRGGLYIDLLFY